MTGPLNDRQVEYVKSIAANAHEVLEWINNSLDLARAEAGRIELKLGPVSIPVLAQSLRDTIEGLARAKGIQYGEE